MGMAGAFVAVADDASAVYWNPAGLATGPFFSMSIEYSGRDQLPETDPAHLLDPARGQSTIGALVGTPPLGLSYLRQRFTEVHPVVPTSTGREPSRTAEDAYASLVTHQAGVTLLHSITTDLIVGTTLKFVRGIASSGTLPAGDTPEDTLGAAADLIGQASNRFDLDAGVLAIAGDFRFGAAFRNLARPGFDAPDGTRLTLDRLARVGAAWVYRDLTTVAADVDLTKTEAVDGTTRRVAIGIEHRGWTRAAVRGGIRFATDSAVSTVVAAGGSVAVKAGLWVDGEWTIQTRTGQGAWGLAGRVAF